MFSLGMSKVKLSVRTEVKPYALTQTNTPLEWVGICSRELQQYAYQTKGLQMTLPVNLVDLYTVYKEFYLKTGFELGEK